MRAPPSPCPPAPRAGGGVGAGSNERLTQHGVFISQPLHNAGGRGSRASTAWAGGAGRRGQLIGGGGSLGGFFLFFPLLLAPFARLGTTQQHTRPTRLYPKNKTKKKLKFAQAWPPFPPPFLPTPSRTPLTPSPGERPDAPSRAGPGQRRVHPPRATPAAGTSRAPPAGGGAAPWPCRLPGSPAPLPDVAAVIALARFALLFLAFLARLLRLLLFLVLPAHAAPKVAREARRLLWGG